MKMIRNKYYPEDFVEWMINIYGREELMPDDNTIFLWCVAFEAGKGIGYNKALEEQQ